MVDAVVDRVGPIGVEQSVEAVAIRQVDLCRADGSDTVERSAIILAY